MKYIAIVLALLLVAAATVTAVTLLSGGITVAAPKQGITALPARDDPDLFARAVAVARSSHDISEADIADYTFYTWRVEIVNNSSVPLEMAEATIHTQPGDVARIGQTEETAVPAHGTASFAITMLSRTATSPAREITVSWYLWGEKHQRTVTVQ